MSEDKVIDFLRGRFTHIDERFDRIELQLDELTTRTNSVEREVGALHRDIAELHIGQGAINQRLERDPVMLKHSRH